MHSVDKEKMLSRYAQRIEEMGHGAAALGEPKERQAFYFDFLAQVQGLSPSDSIVDIGCGYGDMFDYLRCRGWQGRYLGIDINPQLIDEAKRRYRDATFQVLDIQENPPQDVYDWCFCCHALTSATDGMSFSEHLESMLRIMWRCCRRGLVFNMLSPLADYTNPIHARPSFTSVLDVVVKLTNRFAVRHDYMPFEYVVYAYKDNAIDRSLLIFEAKQGHFREVTGRWQEHRSSGAIKKQP